MRAPATSGIYCCSSPFISDVAVVVSSSIHVHPACAPDSSSDRTRLRLGTLAAPASRALSADVQGFPTIKFFGRDKSQAEDYSGARVASSLVKFAEDQASSHRQPKEAAELTGAAVLEEQCAGNQICLVAFLPHILDSKAAGRNGYLATIKEVAKSFIDRPWGYVWVEAGAQPALEAALGVTNYPSAAAVNVKKKAFSIMRTSFSKARANECIHRVRLHAELAGIHEGHVP